MVSQIVKFLLRSGADVNQRAMWQRNELLYELGQACIQYHYTITDEYNLYAISHRNGLIEEESDSMCVPL